MATIYDVAKRVGVSGKTVSRVVNGDAYVAPATREAVEKAIAELGYVPSNAARAMRTNKSQVVGVITGAISHTPEPAEQSGLPDLYILQGIQKAFTQSDMTLMIADTGGLSERVPHLIGAFRRHRVDGMIYVADYHQKVALPETSRRQPLVLANCYDDQGTAAVLPDDRRGQRTLVERIVAQGHSRIAYLTLSPSLKATALRVAGYRDALEAAGIGYDPDLVAAAYLDALGADRQLLWDAVDRLLQLDVPPTAICCGNDRMALRVYDILRSRGIAIPNDMSVAGYDNYRIIAETLSPLLTTMELPYTAIGIRAAEMLISQLAGEASPPTSPALVGGSIHWRASVATRALPVTKLDVVRRRKT